MKTFIPALSVAALALGLGIGAASAQGVIRGSQEGAAAGGAAAGPVGAVVGGWVARWARRRARSAACWASTSVRRSATMSCASTVHRSDMRILSRWARSCPRPASNITRFRRTTACGYRYTIVNNRTVLVDPATHRIVEVVD